MSRSTQQQLAAFVVSEILAARAAREHDQQGVPRPSPERVARLLERFLEGKDTRGALQALSGADTALYRAILHIKHSYEYGITREGHKLVDWPGADRVWMDVLHRLRQFANQEGSQILIPVNKRTQMGQLIRDAVNAVENRSRDLKMGA